jgi:hypothetical protein
VIIRLPVIAALLIALCSLLPGEALAQIKHTLNAPKEGTIDRLSAVTAHRSRWSILSETHGWLAFGTDRNFPSWHVSLVKLDDQGNPSPVTITVKLPRPAALEAGIQQYAASAAFHPKLPLLYVWQDLELHPHDPASQAKAGLDEFDHLVIYRLTAGEPELVGALCRGKTNYFTNQTRGQVAVDPAGERLFVPNIRHKTEPTGQHTGLQPLDADGLPLVTGVDPALPVADRAKRLVEVNASSPVVPAEQTPIEGFNLGWTAHGTTSSLIPLAKDLAYGGNGSSVFIWSPNRVGKNNAGWIHGLVLPGVHVSLLSDPLARPPLLFVTASGASEFFLLQHVDHNLTMVPRQYTIPGTRLHSPPAVMVKRNQVAIGGDYHIYLLTLDEAGRPQPEVIAARPTLCNPGTLVYSPKFDRLYVGGDIPK